MDNLKIVKLSPEYIDDYLYFFENVAHTDYPEFDRCYCISYSGTDYAVEGARADMRDPDVRREFAIEYINKGVQQGYLAYVDGQLVGWCNANDRNPCLKCYGSLFIYGDQKPEEVQEKVKSVFCFIVAPAMRGRHIATRLLERVIEDAKAECYDAVEAYPEIKDMDIYYSYSGHKALYEKLGFELVGETQYRYIVRKQLQEVAK